MLAEFRYHGAAMPAQTNLPQPAIKHRWKKLPIASNGDAGDPYTGNDRFGRTEQMKRVSGTGILPVGSASVPPAALITVQWGYDRFACTESMSWSKTGESPVGPAGILPAVFILHPAHLRPVGLQPHLAEDLAQRPAGTSEHRAGPALRLRRTVSGHGETAGTPQHQHHRRGWHSCTGRELQLR
jgi:hypothetical protein